MKYKYPKSELIFGVIMGGAIAVVMEIFVFLMILKGMRDMATTGVFLPWVDQVFIVTWIMIFLMAMALYGFSSYHLKGAQDEPRTEHESDP